MALFAVSAERVLLARHREDDSSSVCHGDDFLAEGSERTLNELDRLLHQHFEVTAGVGRKVEFKAVIQKYSMFTFDVTSA